MRLCATVVYALIFAASPVAGDVRAADTQPTEYQLKAAYIYHFAQFVDWPASAFPATNAPLVIGILGDNPFGADLPHIVEGKVLNNHPLTVKEFRAVTEAATNCQILFISSSEKRRLPEIFTALKGTSVLTVGEEEYFTQNGGMISFVPDGARIRFLINETTVKNAGLNMSFKLLSLAKQVMH